MTKSMTGFAAAKGALAPWTWTWDMRSVNARGLDIRMRVPDWIEGLEPAIRKAVSERIARGNVSVSLKITRDMEEGGARLNDAALDQALSLLAEVEAAAKLRGVTLTPATAVQVTGMRGVLDAAPVQDDTTDLLARLSSELPGLVADFDRMRAHEGAELARIIEGQLAALETLVAEAVTEADARRDQQAETLRTALARVMENTEVADPDRVAQELALIAVKSDVREELDRLTAHVAQARSLLAAPEPSGRKLDFLMQEFNREANTLCSKAGFQALTRIGLDLKATIDQMREQVQNIE
ncbi:YicC/YloC family endoribonuclease [Maritimibacter sp. DP1N21-5]|uniref:YicC/YloC family endoribonuclease n=1 Tax=Maritimibacter sp. DP1N21-5 TaxID=2836867 RepID=UPI001C44AB9F|nr:YicC/YloC family endoribonuclease [Maritimibacter sp. DP1N21-5]MBV7409927.1 YicC family protein [Maritimibacter sp. DP1N21-5]